MSEQTEMASREDIARAAKIGSDDMANKVAKLLRQAESLPEGSPERETFKEKAFLLQQAYSLDLTLVRAAQSKKERVEEVEERNFKVGDYRGGKVAAGTKHMTDLMMAICDANDIKYLLSRSGVWVFARGFPSDLDMAERLFSILSVEMVSSADAALKRGDHKVKRMVPVTRREEIAFEDRDWGGWNVKAQRFYDDLDEWTDYNNGDPLPEDRAPVEVFSWSMNNGQGGYRKPFPPPTFREVPVLKDDGTPVTEERVVSSVDGRVWRANYYEAFINGIRARLRKAKQQALKDAGIDLADESSSGALAIRDKTKEVADAHEKYVLENYGGAEKMRTFKGAEVNRYDSHAQARGKDAAERARLGDEKDVSGQTKRGIE